MKNIFVVVLFLLTIPFQLFSQENPKDNPQISPEMREKFKNFKGTITGFVYDKDNNMPLQSATVQLFKQKDSSLATGGETDASGKFVFTDVKAGRYKLIASFAGYKKAVMTGIVFTPQTPDLILDTIKMTTGVTTEEIDVTAEKPFVEFKPDMKVFNVDKGMTTTGGSVIDILKNIPGITVDQDNNITFRGGANVKVNIDGRPFGINSSNLSTILEQIPADKVSSVELMTNPTAKFDAEGSSGIINIVMKKNEENYEGMNGSVTMNAGNNDKYNGSLNLNSRSKNYSLNGSYDFRSFNMNMTGYNNRITSVNNSPTNIYSESDNQNRMRSNLVRAGIDLTLTKKQNLGFTFSYNNRQRNRGGSNETSVFDNSTLTSDYLTRDFNYNDGKTYGIGANYLLKFEKPKQTLTSDFSYTRSEGDRTQNTLIDYSLPLNFPQARNNQFSNDKNDEVNFQLDFISPFSENSKLETGVKSIYRKTYDDSRSESYDYNTNTFVQGANSNIFDYQELINSAYIAYTDKIGNFSYQLGLRGEQTNSKGNQITANTDFTKSYFSIFPNASISQKLGATEEVQLSYSRRIRRPDLDDLNPFLNTSDPLNYQSGNPDLMPEYTNSLELNFIKYFTSAIITPSIYYRQTNDKISRVRLRYDSLITLNTQENFASSKSYGFELTMNASPVKTWTINGTVGYSKTENDATNLTGLTNTAYSWNGRLFTTLSLPADFGLQFTYFYSGKNISAQGQIDPFSSADISLKKDFMDKRLSLNLRVGDVFNSQKFHGTISDINFYDEFERRRDSRSVFLSLTYKFGSEGKQDRKKKREPNNNEPIEIPDGF
ncbi:MAG: TonB-dependent receptor [Ignavibacteria bacterium]|nr:TonB-dependent receptor [Ignavibacteria bacterium]